MTSKDFDSDSFTLEVPSDPAYLATIRLFAGSVARHYECSEDSIDDLKVALTEACTNSIVRNTKAQAQSSIRLQVALESSKLSFSVRDGGVGLTGLYSQEADKLEAPTDEITRVLGMELIRALFPDAQLDSNTEGGTDIKFSIDTASGPQ